MNDLISLYRKQLVKYSDLMTEHVKMLDSVNSEYKSKFKRSDFWKVMFITDFIWMNAALLLFFIYLYISGKETFMESLVITYLLLFGVINIALIIGISINRYKNKINKDKYDILCASCEKRRIAANSILKEAANNAIKLMIDEDDADIYNKKKNELIEEVKKTFPNIDLEYAICEYLNNQIKEQNNEVAETMTEEEKQKLLELKERLYK